MLRHWEEKRGLENLTLQVYRLVTKYKMKWSWPMRQPKNSEEETKKVTPKDIL